MPISRSNKERPVAIPATRSLRALHDLRGTAVARLLEAECTPQEIATITGHSLRDVSAIMDSYSARTDKIAVGAIAKLERGGR
jgi:hypothetical protein